MTTRQETCGGCFFWEWSPGATTAPCHRYPPTQDHDQPFGPALQPGTRRDDWCGEFKPQTE